MAPLFTIPITSTGGSIVCTNPGAEQNVYLLTFSSPPDNRLTPTFIDAFILALDIIEHRYPKGVVVTTSGIPKFYSNGLDLDVVAQTEGFLEKWLWRLFRRLLTYAKSAPIEYLNLVPDTNLSQISHANNLPAQRPRICRWFHAGHVPRLPHSKPSKGVPLHQRA